MFSFIGTLSKCLSWLFADGLRRIEMKRLWRAAFDKRFDAYIKYADSKFLHATFLDPRFKKDSILFEPRELLTPLEEFPRSNALSTAAALPIAKYDDAVYRSITAILRQYPARFDGYL